MQLAAKLLFAGVAVVSMRHTGRKLVTEFPGIRRAPRYSAASPVAVRAADRDARASVQWLRWSDERGCRPWPWSCATASPAAAGMTEARGQDPGRRSSMTASSSRSRVTTYSKSTTLTTSLRLLRATLTRKRVAAG